MDDISRIATATKMVEKKALKIEKKAINYKPILGGEPMVKIPRKMFDELLTRYKLTETLERLYNYYYGKYTAQQGLIQELKSEISSLNNKIRQFTNFIEAKGLVEAFKEFIAPRVTSIKETLKLNKAKVAGRTKRKPELSPKKKNRSSVR